MSELREWNTAAANNNSAPPNGAPENMNYSAVNDTMREMMAVVARYERDTRGGITAGGTANALTVTPAGTYAAYFTGMQIGFEAASTNTGAATLNVGAVGAAAIVTQDGNALQGGELVAGGIYQVVYDGTNWQLRSSATPASLALGGTASVDLTDANAILRVGAAAAQHLEADGDEIQSKSDATTAAAISINRLGGNVNLGAQSGTGRVNMYYNGSVTVYNVASGLRFGSVGNGLLEEDTALTPDGILLRNLTVSGLLYLQGQDSGDAQTTMFRGDPNGAATLYYDGTPALATSSIGAVIDAANATLQLRDGAAETAFLQKNDTDGKLYIRNQEHGVGVVVQAENASGVVTDLFNADPDDSMYMYHAGVLALRTDSSGARVYSPAGAATHAIFRLYDGDDNQAYLRKRADSANLEIKNTHHGGGLYITAENVSGVEKVLIEADPDDSVALHYTGEQTFGTESGGIGVRPTTAGANPLISLREIGGATQAQIGYLSSGIYGYRSFVHGAIVALQGEDAGGSNRNIIIGDPDGATDLYYNGTVALATTSVGIEVTATTTDPRIVLFDSTATEKARFWYTGSNFYIDSKENSAPLRIRANNAGGSTFSLFVGDPDGAVTLYYAGTSEVQTQDSDANYNTSGLTTRDHGGTFRDVGFNDMPVVEQDTAVTLNEDHVGKILHRDGTASMLITLPSGTSGAVPPVGGLTMITNENGTGALTIAAAGTLRWFAGAGTPATGTRTLAEGGVASVYHYSNTEWWIWGSGLS